MTSSIARNTSGLHPRAWLTVALLCVVGCLNYLDRTMITTMRTSIMADVPMTEAQFGLLTSVFLWVYGFLSPFAGFLADRFNRSKVIIISLFVWSGVTWLTAYAKTFEQLLATRALMGISEACYIPAALALIVDYHRNATRSLASGIHLAGVMVGSSLGFTGGWIAEKHNWNSVFVIFGAIGIVYAVFLLFILRDPPAQKEKPGEKAQTKIRFFEAVKDLFKRRSFNFMFIYWGLMGIVSWFVVGWLPTFYKEQFSLSQGLAGLYATGYLYPAALLGLVAGGYWADRWSRVNTRARILVPVIGVCIGAPCIFIAGSEIILPLTIICMVFFSFTRVFGDANMMPILCMVADQRYCATGYGILNFLSAIIGGVGLYAGGVLRDMEFDLGIMFQFAALIMIVAGIMLYLVRPRHIEE